MHDHESAEREATDEELLRRAAGGSRAALGEIARRYAGFVYHSALRNLRDPHVAADVTQAVFLILSSKAARLSPRTVLHAWLFTTTRYAAANARKLQARRAHHEQVAAAMRQETIESHPAEANDADAHVAALLDEALADLRETDRTAVLLSYFGGHTFAQVGARIGKSEEAARKRVGRAVDKMRAFFARRGVEVGSAALLFAMRSRADAAAPEQVIRAIHACVAGAPVATGALGIADGVRHMIQLMRLKLAALCAAGTLIVGAGGAAVLATATSTSSSPRTTAYASRGASSSSTAAPATHPNGASVQLRDGVRVTLLGVAAVAADDRGWWDPMGQRVPAPCDESDAAPPGAEYQAAVLVEGPRGASVAVRVGPCSTNYNGDATRDGKAVRGLYRAEFQPDDGVSAVNIFVRVGTKPHVVLLDCADPAAGAEVETPEGQVTLDPIEDDGRGNARATFHHALADHDVRVVAVDADGKELSPFSERTGSDGTDHELTAIYDAPPARIKRLRLEARPLGDWVQFREVPLDPARAGAFTIVAGDDPTTQPGR